MPDLTAHTLNTILISKYVFSYFSYLLSNQVNSMVSQNHQPQFEGTATVGERGQVVIPSKVRKRLKIKTGDRLVVFTHRGNVVGFMKATELNAMLDSMTRTVNQRVRSLKKKVASAK